MDEFALHFKTISCINYRTQIITESCRVNCNAAFCIIKHYIKHVNGLFKARRHFKYP